MTRDITTARDLADAYLQRYGAGQPLADFIADRRDNGASWAEVAVALEEESDGVIQVGRDTVRRWYLQLTREAA